MIDRITVDKIMDAANIVDVVSDFVTLKRAGANLKGLCPFHNDNSPSFVVSPAKNLCKCFACGEGGTPLNFLMKHEGISYPEALRYLAKKYGIPIEEKELTPEEMRSRDDRESMFIVNEWAKNWFIQQLKESMDGKAIGMAYFRGRGFRDDILEKFQVGFCPERNHHAMTDAALEAGYDKRYLLNTPDEKEPKNSIGTGLTTSNPEGKDLKDKFHGRVMWPIFTIGGKIAGFGGRVLDSRTHGVNVKYLNSPESIVYSKRKELFGLFQAKTAIRQKDRCFIVEGYTDVMAMHQNGMENVVASSGTALTFDQIRLLKRLTNNITLVFDGDEAGIKASLRGTDMLLSEGMSLKLLLLPEGEDPDSFGRSHTATEFQEYMNSHQVDFIQYKTETLMKEAENDPGKQGQVAGNIVESIASVPDEITRAFYIRQAAQMLHLDEKMILRATQDEMARKWEEKRKEEERERNRRNNIQETPIAPESTEKEDDASPTPTEVKEEEKKPTEVPIAQETLLAKMIIEHGSTSVAIIEDENGHPIGLSLTEYIQASLQADEINFETPIYKVLLSEAYKYARETDFDPKRYFLNHENTRLRKLAFWLTNDEELSKFYKMEGKEANGSDPNSLLHETDQLLSELKLVHVRREIQELLSQAQDSRIRANKEEFKKLMARFQTVKNLEKELASECGNRVIQS